MTEPHAAARAAGWWRAVALLAVALVFVSSRACERYTMEHQGFPALDWLEAQRPQDESTGIPPAADLARGVVPILPYLGVGGPPERVSPSFEPPGIFVRRIAGVRDAVSILKTTPIDGPIDDRASMRLSVMVFYRATRATAWAELRATQLDLARPTAGEVYQYRVGGPGDRDRVWITAPEVQQLEGGRATLVGSQGPVAYQVEVFTERAGGRDPQTRLDLSARAEQIARRVGAEWTTWLATQLPTSQPTAGEAGREQPQR